MASSYFFDSEIVYPNKTRELYLVDGKRPLRVMKFCDRFSVAADVCILDVKVWDDHDDYWPSDEHCVIITTPDDDRDLHEIYEAGDAIIMSTTEAKKKVDEFIKLGYKSLYNTIIPNSCVPDLMKTGMLGGMPTIIVERKTSKKRLIKTPKEILEKYQKRIDFIMYTYRCAMEAADKEFDASMTTIKRQRFDKN